MTRAGRGTSDTGAGRGAGGGLDRQGACHYRGFAINIFKKNISIILLKVFKQSSCQGPGYRGLTINILRYSSVVFTLPIYCAGSVASQPSAIILRGV